MKNLRRWCAALLAALPVLCFAKDYPLEFRTVNAQEAMALPGGSVVSGILQVGKPAGITRMPPAISRYPLYGQLRPPNQRNPFWFRLDESKGDGKGYDQLIVDLNGDGDLTDDTVALRADKPASTTASTLTQIMLFGPIQLSEKQAIGKWRPVYYAQVYLRSLPSGIARMAQASVLGQLRLKAGWYLETVASIDGMSRKIGILDGNCNGALGDASLPTISKSANQENWYFPGGDYFLEDRNGSGKFETTVFVNEATPFGPLLYLEDTPCKATLAPDCQTLSLEPWSEPLAELDVQPRGTQVDSLQLAWESVPGRWQLLQVGVIHGKVKVPPGNYRFYACTLKVRTAAGDSLVLTGSKRSAKDIVVAGANQTTLFKCGAPLELKVTAERESGGILESSGSLGARIISAFSSAPLQRRLQASVMGAGGETYSSFYLEGKTGLRQPPKPSFTITTADGKKVASGNMEFG